VVMFCVLIVNGHYSSSSNHRWKNNTESQHQQVRNHGSSISYLGGASRGQHGSECEQFVLQPMSSKNNYSVPLEEMETRQSCQHGWFVVYVTYYYTNMHCQAMQSKFVVHLDTKPGEPWPLIAQVQPPSPASGWGLRKSVLK
jgi:hypothetical protein